MILRFSRNNNSIDATGFASTLEGRKPSEHQARELAAANLRQEMHLATLSEGMLETLPADFGIDDESETWAEGFAIAEARLDARIGSFQRGYDLSHRVAGHGKGFLAVS